MRTLLVLSLAFPLAAPAGEIEYRGTLGNQPIHLYLDAYSDGTVRAIYAYDRHDTPIRVDGRVADGALELVEVDGKNARVATLRLAPFDEAASALNGEWIASSGGKRLPVALDALREDERAVLQAASTREHYFLLTTDAPGDSYDAQANAVQVVAKGSDRVLQAIELGTQWRGIDSVSVGDFNFDGVDDFAVFEASAAGPNTTSRYFLRDPTGRYVEADYQGTSLEFDADAKLVHETNSCCAGTSVINATYRVVANHLELVERTCLKWDAAEDGLVDAPCEE